MGITAGVGALIGGVVGGGASIAGGIMGSNAAQNAASTQAAAANHAADLQKQAADQALAFSKQQYGNSLNIMSPWINTGQSANTRLAYLMGLNPNQGLPPGVVNPNAPATAPASRPGDLAGALGGAFDNNPVLNRIRGGGGVPQPMQAAGMMQAGQNPLLGNSTGTQQYTMQSNGPLITSGGATTGPNGLMTPNNPITSPMQNPDVGRFAPGATPGGAAGMLNSNGSTTPDFNPPGGTLNLNPGGNAPTPATTNQGDTGQVPQTGAPQVLGDGGIEQQLFGQGGLGGFGGGPNTGGFGSLAQGWNQTVQSPTDVTEQNDPGYQFRLQQGQKALEASAAARGGLLTGGTSKAINDYAQNSASGEYSNVYNRSLQNYMTNYNTFSNDQSNLFNRLSALSGTGQTSAGQLSAAGITTAGNQGNILLGSAGQIGQQINNAGAANASGYVGSSNALAGGIGGAANSLGGALSLYQLLNAQKGQ